MSDSDADIYTVEEFKKHCERGLFTDYDGSAFYGTGTEEKDIQISCVDFLKAEKHPHTHIHWYNK